MNSLSKTFAAIAAVLALIGSLAACSSEDGDAEPSAEETWEVCISNGSFPPMYVNHADGELDGFDPDMARAAAEEMGVEIKFTKLAFEGLMPGIASGRCNAVWSSFYISDERLEVADAVPYLRTGPGLIVAADNTDIKTPEDLAGKTVAVQSGSSFIDQLNALNEDLSDKGLDAIKIAQYKHYPEEVAAMSNGRADALLDSSVVLPDIVAKNSELKLVPGFFPQDVEYGVYLVKDSPVINKLAKALAAMKEAGTSAKIAEKYMLNSDDLVTPKAQ